MYNVKKEVLIIVIVVVVVVVVVVVWGSMYICIMVSKKHMVKRKHIRVKMKMEEQNQKDNGF